MTFRPRVQIIGLMNEGGKVDELAVCQMVCILVLQRSIETISNQRRQTEIPPKFLGVCMECSEPVTDNDCYGSCIFHNV